VKPRAALHEHVSLWVDLIHQAIQSLAMICFVCAVEEEGADELLALLDKYYELKIAGPVCASALHAWGLIVSNFPDDHLSTTEFIDR
jgi:hypothetical protein